MWLGGAISYTDGNNDFANGDGDSETYAFTGYGSWLADNGMFVDVTGKVGRLKNSFDISTTLGTASTRTRSRSPPKRVGASIRSTTAFTSSRRSK